MSHIDSFKHETVGLFAGIPVYHPLEDIHADFSCTTEQLVLGGGSGEHPAMVIADPHAAVATFLETLLDDFTAKDTAEDWRNIISAYNQFDTDKILKFYDWRIDDYARFANLCRSAGLPNPYRDDGISLELWLVLGFGEFIFYAMPDLASNIMQQLHEPYTHIHHIWYNNILLLPPNMPVYSNAGHAFRLQRQN